MPSPPNEWGHHECQELSSRSRQQNHPAEANSDLKKINSGWSKPQEAGEARTQNVAVWTTNCSYVWRAMREERIILFHFHNFF